METLKKGGRWTCPKRGQGSGKALKVLRNLLEPFLRDDLPEKSREQHLISGGANTGRNAGKFESRRPAGLV